MHTEHLFARWMEPNSSSWANPAVKTVPFALSGCVPNPCSAAQNAFAMLKKDADKRITIIIAHGELPEGLINVDING